MIHPARLLPRIFITSIALLLCACNRNAPVPPAAPSAKPPAPAIDQSLPANDYIALGMPSYDRPWFGKDMALAASRLQSIAAKTPEQLPRFASTRSGPMFARIIAPDNLDFFRSHSIPLTSRLPQSLVYFQSLNEIFKIYAAAQPSSTSGDDVVELMGAELRTVQVELELVNEFLPTLSKDDPKYAVRMAGFDQMRSGLATMVNGVLTTLTEEHNYGIATRSKLLVYCRENLPAIVPKLSAPSQVEVLRRLDDLVDDPSVRDLRPQIIGLRDEVQTATKTSTPP